MDDKIDEVKRLADKLEAIAYWRQDQIQQETQTGRLLNESAKWLRKLSRDMCGRGYVGCDGGHECSSDHK